MNPGNHGQVSELWHSVKLQVKTNLVTTKLSTHCDMFQLRPRPVYHTQQTFHHATAHKRFSTSFVTRQMVQETEQSSGKRQGKLTACCISMCRCQCHDARTDQHRKETMIRSRTRHINYHVQSGTRFSVSKPQKTNDVTTIHNVQQCTHSQLLSHKFLSLQQLHPWFL